MSRYRCIREIVLDLTKLAAFGCGMYFLLSAGAYYGFETAKKTTQLATAATNVRNEATRIATVANQLLSDVKALNIPKANDLVKKYAPPSDRVWPASEPALSQALQP